MRDYIITIFGAFFICCNQCKTFKGSCNKKSYKKFDVTIDITSNECYSTNNTKDVYKEMLANPEVEVSVSSSILKILMV